MPRDNLTPRKLRRASINSVAPSRPGTRAYDPELGAILVSSGGVWMRHDGDATPVDPTVTVPAPDGYIGTTASVTADGVVTITNAATFLMEPDLEVFHYYVRAENMLGKRLTVRRSTRGVNKNGGRLTEWQMAWSANPDSDEWHPFDNVIVETGVLVASNNMPCAHNTIWIARRPVFTTARWDATIARWKTSPLTLPTPSANAEWVIGTLPANQYAPAMAAFGFKFGTGPRHVVLTGNIHTGEHIGAFAMEALVDWLLGSDLRAVWLRDNVTFSVYPKLNPQGRYAGSSRAEPYTGNTTNSNRIFNPPSAYQNIPLSKVMTDAWEIDVPHGLDFFMDFHDTASQPGRGFVFENNGLAFTSRWQPIYTARTGYTPIIEASAALAGIGAYFRDHKGAVGGLAVEHQQSPDVSIPEWKLYGIDFGIALRQYIEEVPAVPPSQPDDWITPTWLTSPDTPETTDGSGNKVYTRATGNPRISMQIPAGKTIEIVFALALTNADFVSFRHSDGESIAMTAPAVTTELARIKNSPTSTTFTVTDDGKGYIGLILARKNSSLAGSIKVGPSTKYRVLP